MEQGYKKSEIDEIFTLVSNKEGKIVIVTGGYQVVEDTFDTFEAAELYISAKPYKLIFNTILILLDYAEQKENAEKTEKDASSN